MKIFHIIYSFNIGGAEKFLKDIANQQSISNSNEIGLVIINNYYSDEMLGLLSPNVKVFKINRIPGSRSPFPVLKLNMLLINERPDIINCHNEDIIKYLYIPKHTKTVLTIHQKDMEIGCLKKYDKCFCVSDFVVNHLKTMYDGDNLVRIYNGVVFNGKDISNNDSYTDSNDRSELKKNEKPSCKDPENSDFRIVQIGRLVTECKGQHLMIEAVSDIVRENKIKIHLDFYGKGDSEEDLKEVVKELSLEDYISFKGEIDSNAIFDVLPTYNLLVQPSLFEALGLTIIEAMGCGVPVLVSDIDGPAEIVNLMDCGSLFKTGNVNDLTKKIVDIYNNYQIYCAQANNNIGKVKDFFSIEKCCQEYEKEYLSLIGNA